MVQVTYVYKRAPVVRTYQFRSKKMTHYLIWNITTTTQFHKNQTLSTLLKLLLNISSKNFRKSPGKPPWWYSLLVKLHKIYFKEYARMATSVFTGWDILLRNNSFRPSQKLPRALPFTARREFLDTILLFTILIGPTW